MAETVSTYLKRVYPLLNHHSAFTPVVYPGFTSIEILHLQCSRKIHTIF